MLRSRGKKTKQWDKVRAELKKEFYDKGIISCEICGYADALSFAHRVKRRYIAKDDEAELRCVALLCMDIGTHKGCHNLLEYGDKQVMFDVISEIIANR